MTTRHNLTKWHVFKKLPMVLIFLLVACTMDKPTGNSGGGNPPPPPPPNQPPPPPPNQPPPPPVLGGWHVSPNGSSSASGAIDHPWTLSFALSGAGGRIQPGDTVWMHAGTYRGAFVATVAGTSGHPVVIRQYPGERAIIDVAGATSTSARGDAFIVKGAWTVWWGFEMMSSDPNRQTNTRPNMIVNDASNTKYINLVVHDGGIGVYTYSQFTNVEVNGSIFYNNGWQRVGVASGGGHGLYLKSDAGPLVIKDNIMFSQFGYGVQVYSEPGDGGLVNITLDGNVAFNNGSVSAAGASSSNANLLMGGVTPIQNGRVTNNMTYYSPGYGVYNVEMGFEGNSNANTTLQNNYAVGGQYVLSVGYWSQMSASNNRLFGTGRVIQLKDTTLSGFTWTTNTYQRDPLASAWQYKGTDYAFATWITKTGLGRTDVTLPVTPTTAQVFVRPNTYEAGRAHVVVYNWGHAASVSVDLSSVLSSGAKYEIRNVQDLFGTPVASGTFNGGSINIPMSGVAPPQPIGGAAHAPPRTGPDFDVFVVRRVN